MTRRSAAWPALACIAVWGTYLLAFWPGLMSPDSITQWSQLLDLRELNDNHPAAHTLAMWLVTRAWQSPAAVALVQILGLAVVFAAALRELARWGVSARARRVVTALFALSPVNGVMTITLWKDIPYTIAMLGLFGLVMGWVRTRGAVARSRSWAASFVVAVTCAALFRHNGPPTLALLLITLWVAGRGTVRRRMLWIGAASAALYLLAVGPAYRLIGVRPTDRYFASSVVIHQLGAYVHEDRRLSASEETLLAMVQPLSEWRERYTCASLDRLVYSPHVSPDAVRGHVTEFARLWRRLVTRHPRTLLRHQLCVSELIWCVWGGVGAMAFDTHPRSIPPNRFGFVERPLLPLLAPVLTALVEWTTRPPVQWLVWRPALYLYVGVLCALVAARRRRDSSTLLVLAPAIAQSVVMMAVNTMQDFRFQYPVYVMALVSLGLLRCERADDGA